MAEQTFRSPGFFEREIDLSQRETQPLGVPAAIIGTAEKGPAFVPVTIGSFKDFEARFGTLDSDRFGPYAVREYLKNRDAVTFMRVLGAGSNDTTAEVSNTENYGVVSKAGFWVKSAASSGIAHGSGSEVGKVQFLCAKHYISASEADVGFPTFIDNDSFPSLSTGGTVNLVRAMLFSATGSHIEIASWDDDLKIPVGGGGDKVSRWRESNQASICSSSTNAAFHTFKIIISSSDGTDFASDDGFGGLRVFSASLDPSSVNYVAKVLNTDPWKFQERQHLLYIDYAVEHAIAPVAEGFGKVAIISGSDISNPIGLGDVWLDSFGRFDTRYTTPSTPKVISQPFGTREFDLFHFETISDGEYSNNQYKVSVSNVRASNDLADEYGLFDIEVRLFDDTDQNKKVVESYPQCSLNPNSDRYIARLIGDYKLVYDFDATDDAERRLVISGKYANVSALVRVVLSSDIVSGEVPAAALPFGFRGIPVLKSTDSFTDSSAVTITGSSGISYGFATGSNTRMTFIPSGSDAPAGGDTGWDLYDTSLTASIVPPLPFRFKCTRGKVSANPSLSGWPGLLEISDNRLYWGVKFESCPLSSSVAHATLDTNVSDTPNPLIKAYTKFQGIAKNDTLVTGSAADLFNNNKFTLARVALIQTDGAVTVADADFATLTGSANEHMLDACYLRNGSPSTKDYTIKDGAVQRLTMATLLNSSSVKFNRFQAYNKFTFPFYGGFDGLNILDKNCHLMTDRAASTKVSQGSGDQGGLAGPSIPGGLKVLGTDDGSMMGKDKQNNVVFAYRTAINVMTDPMVTSANLLAVPGVRDPYITDLAMSKVKDYSMAMYLMDIEHYDSDQVRLYLDQTTKRPDVRETSEQFESRRIDNNYIATYFPDVFIEDPVNNRNVMVPSSVVSLGALGFNDTVAYPWFAPAGFNRGALGFVVNTEVRLTSGDRDTLYDARINPIANFPNGGFVIFGQKTLQMQKSALDRVNVRRMLLEVKRLVVRVAEKLLFEPNTPKTRQRFIGQVTPILGLIQAQQGIEKFAVVMDATNNTRQDVEENKLNGRIILVPTRTIEFIAVDFIITNSGVIFE